VQAVCTFSHFFIIWHTGRAIRYWKVQYGLTQEDVSIIASTAFGFPSRNYRGYGVDIIGMKRLLETALYFIWRESC
jgi:hypothetical protein